MLLLRIDPSAAELFAAYTQEHVGEYLAITHDGTVVSAPLIQEAILNGEILIQTDGGLASDELDGLVRIINGGPLPAALREAGA